MTVREELLAFQDEDGLINAKVAVEWARENPESALHGSLNWNDADAAEEHRIWQVRRLIKVHIVTDEGEPEVVSLSVDRKNGGGYRQVSEVIASKDLSAVMLADALAELNRVRARYNRVAALAKVWKEVDAVVETQAKKPAPKRSATTERSVAAAQ